MSIKNPNGLIAYAMTVGKKKKKKKKKIPKADSVWCLAPVSTSPPLLSLPGAARVLPGIPLSAWRTAPVSTSSPLLFLPGAARVLPGMPLPTPSGVAPVPPETSPSVLSGEAPVLPEVQALLSPSPSRHHTTPPRRGPPASRAGTQLTPLHTPLSRWWTVPSLISPLSPGGLVAHHNRSATPGRFLATPPHRSSLARRARTQDAQLPSASLKGTPAGLPVTPGRSLNLAGTRAASPGRHFPAQQPTPRETPEELLGVWPL